MRRQATENKGKSGDLAALFLHSHDCDDGARPMAALTTLVFDLLSSLAAAPRTISPSIAIASGSPGSLGLAGDLFEFGFMMFSERSEIIHGSIKILGNFRRQSRGSADSRD